MGSTGVFGRDYSSLYDNLYRSKDYARECDFLEAAFRRSGRAVRSVLDLGCGTGGHALLLARRGYDVTGVDRSPEMLKLARAKAAAAGLPVKFRRGDVTSVRLGRRFDAVICMFAVIGYLPGNAQVAAACRTARAHLGRGVFVLDCWNGAAVLAQKPEARVKRLPLDGGLTLLRETAPALDAGAHTVALKIRSTVLRGRRAVRRFSESHLVRYFFPQELAYYLETAGFRAAAVTPFPRLRGRVTERDWNIAVIAHGGKR